MARNWVLRGMFFRQASTDILLPTSAQTSRWFAAVGMEETKLAIRLFTSNLGKLYQRED